MAQAFAACFSIRYLFSSGCHLSRNSGIVPTSIKESHPPHAGIWLVPLIERYELLEKKINGTVTKELDALNQSVESANIGRDGLIQLPHRALIQLPH